MFSLLYFSEKSYFFYYSEKKMKNFDSVGAVFTPIKWAKWLIREFNIHTKWINGASVFDPTAGDGSFIFALIESAEETGIKINSDILSRLFYSEKEEKYASEFSAKFISKYNKPFPPQNLFINDIILNPPDMKFDILVGNPPWVNFNDLKNEYKETLKKYFIEYKLTQNPKSLLLGSSRIDLAALVLFKTIHDNLKQNGEAFFFIPMSIFLNDGAHCGFRKYKVKDINFKINQIYDLNLEKVFKDVATRFGVVSIKKNEITEFPIKYNIFNNSEWESHYASPLFNDDAPLSVFKTQNEFIDLEKFEHIKMRKEQLPRQGVNTCGANDVFIFNKYPDFISDEYLFPLAAKDCFIKENPSPSKFILLLYDPETAKPLSEDKIRKDKSVWEYLNVHKQKLISRKGLLINGWVNKGMWWACLGVGKYSFSPYKIIWEAFGRDSFNPVLLKCVDKKPWQGNQALHAFIPSWSSEDSENILHKMKNHLIEKYLKSTFMEGTCNWAQPGRIKKIMTILKDNNKYEQLTLF